MNWDLKAPMCALDCCIIWALTGTNLSSMCNRVIRMQVSSYQFPCLILPESHSLKSNLWCTCCWLWQSIELCCGNEWNGVDWGNGKPRESRRNPRVPFVPWFEVVHFNVIVFWIAAHHAINLWSGKEMVSVPNLKLNCHLRITFVSERPPSANNLSFASIIIWGIGSFVLSGQAVTSISRGIAAFKWGMHIWCLGCWL